MNLVADMSLQLGELCELRRRLREQMQASICNTKRFARNLENAYRQMWHHHCGLPVDHTQLKLLGTPHNTCGDA